MAEENTGMIGQPQLSGSGFEKADDKSLYWTVSFYISHKRLPEKVRQRIDAGILASPEDADSLRSMQNRHAASKTLSEAMEPLFNDISDRERLGRVDDYLFSIDYPAAPKGDAKGADAPKRIALKIAAPSDVRWETEGDQYEASPGALGARDMFLRRFWYVHKNGAVSWHLSFSADYHHTPAFFYFISMLQKVLAPKEFRPPADGKLRNGGQAKAIGETLFVHAPGGDTGIEPIDGVTVSQGDESQPFWQAVAAWFQADAPDFFNLLTRNEGWEDAGAPRLAQRDLFKELMEREPFLEIPGLLMPRFRFMFFFKDREFFRHLLPPLDPETKEPTPRAALVKEDEIKPYLELMDEVGDLADRSAGKVRKLDGTYWAKVKALRDDRETRYNRIDSDWSANMARAAKLSADAKAQAERLVKIADDLEAKAGTPAEQQQAADARLNAILWQQRALDAEDRDKADDNHGRPIKVDDLIYLFLSGFNQNIIDFMNQDASEILDSMDPIYPANDEQAAEGFFVRFANARALTTYVISSRSLETGNDYIGTCPYAFLIHVVALHNEFLARDYEKSTHDLIRRVQEMNRKDKLRQAAQAFYRFRTETHSAYQADRYDNVFRYDTEKDVFTEVEQRRGVARKTEYLREIISNLENQTELLLARLQRKEDRVVTYAVASVGAFGIFQILLQIATMKPAGDEGASGDGMSDGDFLHWLMFPWELNSLPVAISLLGTWLIILVFLIVLGSDLVQWLGQRWHRWFTREGREESRLAKEADRREEAARKKERDLQKKKPGQG